MEQVRRDPSTYGLERSRWTLALIRDKSSLLPDHLSVSAVHRNLAALGICWKRGRSYVHSPDALYDAKCRSIAEIRQEVKADTSSLALLYLDEVTFERQPSLSNDYESRGATSQPLGRRSIGSNVTTRYVASMDALTGRVISHPSGRALRAPTPNLRGALSTSSKLVNPAERGSEAKVVASESSNSDRAVANLRLVAEPNREALEVDASGTWTLASLGR